MIRVSIDPDALSFRLDGHAGYAPEGQDIVCSAASMLTAALFEYVMRIADEEELAECEMEPGHASLDVCPARAEVMAQCRHAFEMAECGFELLAARYPDNLIID